MLAILSKKKKEKVYFTNSLYYYGITKDKELIPKAPLNWFVNKNQYIGSFFCATPIELDDNWIFLFKWTLISSSIKLYLNSHMCNVRLWNRCYSYLTLIFIFALWIIYTITLLRCYDHIFSYIGSLKYY